MGQVAFVEPNSHVKRAKREPSIKWRLYAEMGFLGAQDKADSFNCVGVVVFVEKDPKRVIYVDLAVPMTVRSGRSRSDNS